MRRPLPPRKEQKRATRERLLEAARGVLRTQGLAAATTRRIAEEAGVSTGTFFVHFPDVPSLVQVLLDELLERVLAEAFAALPPGQTAVEDLVFLSGRLFDGYDVSPELSRAYITQALFPSGADPGQLDQRLLDYQAWTVARLERAFATGELPRLDVRFAFTAYFSLYFGALVAGLRGLMPRQAQLEFLRAALTRLFNAAPTRKEERTS